MYGYCGVVLSSGDTEGQRAAWVSELCPFCLHIYNLPWDPTVITGSDHHHLEMTKKKFHGKDIISLRRWNAYLGSRGCEVQIQSDPQLLDACPGSDTTQVKCNVFFPTLNFSTYELIQTSDPLIQCYSEESLSLEMYWECLPTVSSICMCCYFWNVYR